MNQIFGSGWGSLLWKEWRQQRAAALLLGLFCLLGYVGFCWFYRWEPEGTVLVLLLALVALSLGTSSFTAEADDRTAAFMGQLPLPPWRILVAKYLMATGLVALCMVPIFVVFAVLVKASVSYRWSWAMLSPVTIFLLATSVVAVTGAIARQGLRGMGTLLATGALCAVALVQIQPAKRLLWGVCRIVVGEQDFFLAFWCVAHLWLLRVWVWKARSKPGWGETIGWAAVFLLVPLGPRAALSFYQRPRPIPPSLTQRSITSATVSPNGQDVVLVRTVPGDPPARILDIVPLDAETDTAPHPGIERQRHRLRFSPGSQLHWSPDGMRILVYENPDRESYPLFETDGKTAAEQWILNLRKRMASTAHKTPDALVISWLKDGTKAVCTPTAWEFTDAATGKTQRCLHPPDGDPVGKQFYQARSSQCDDGIHAAAIERSDAGGAICHVWRSAPDLPQAERRDFHVDLDLDGMPEDLLPARMSPDGNWLLFTLVSTERHPFWLLSLADGTCRRLESGEEELPPLPMFTPDSGLLLLRRHDWLAVMELPNYRWREPYFLPAPGGGHRPRFRTCAERPHRLAVTAGQFAATFVVDLDQRTSVQVFPEADASNQGRNSHRVLWFNGERLVLEKTSPYQIWAVNADGTNCQQVLP